MYRTDWVLMAFFFIFQFLSGSYFGWNFLPASAEEVIADGIAAIILSIAVASRRNI